MASHGIAECGGREIAKTLCWKLNADDPQADRTAFRPSDEHTLLQHRYRPISEGLVC